MKFDPPLQRGTLLRRYKRFLADITLEDGTEVTAHCPNPGAMMGLDVSGSGVWVARAANPKARLAWSWKLVELETGLVGIDTGVPNKVVGEALRAGAVAELTRHADVRAEVKYGENSRIDFLLRGAGLADAYVEVKNVHLSREAGLAEFPDCVTSRGAKHLRELSAMVAAGHRAVMVYLVQRTDCDRFALAGDLDPGYLAAFQAARDAGVEALCYDCRIGLDGVELGRRLDIVR